MQDTKYINLPESVKLITEKKKALEIALLRTIKTFEDETGVEIRDIRLTRVSLLGRAKSEPEMVTVEVRVP